MVYVWISDYRRVKLASKEYSFYGINTKVVLESNDVKFYEYKYPFKLKNSGCTTSDHIPVTKNIDENIKHDVIEPQRGTRARVVKEYGPDYVAYTLDEVPLSLKEDFSSLDVELWQEGINDKMDSLESRFVILFF